MDLDSSATGYVSSERETSRRVLNPVEIEAFCRERANPVRTVRRGDRDHRRNEDFHGRTMS